MVEKEKHRKRCQRYNIPGHAHELTFSCYRGQKFLSRQRVCDYLVQAILAAREKHSFSLWAYVFMPEHVNLLICPNRQNYSISGILQGIKQPVGRRCIMYLRQHNPIGLKWLETGQNDRPYRFWQDGGGYDRNITKDKTLVKVVDYLHRNPVRRGLVASEYEWRWSSIHLWKGEDGPLPVDFDSWPLP